MTRNTAIPADGMQIRVPAEEGHQKGTGPPLPDGQTPSTPEMRNRMGVNSPRLKTRKDRQPTRTGTESQYEEEYDYDDEGEYYDDYDGEAGATTHGYHQQQQQQGYASNGGGGGASDLVTQVARPVPNDLVTQVARPDPNAKRPMVPQPPASRPSKGPSRPAEPKPSTNDKMSKDDMQMQPPSKKRLTGLARLCSCFMPARDKDTMGGMDGETDKSPETELAPVVDADKSSRRSSESSEGSYAQEDALLTPRTPENRHKKTLVLDLDETLVHSSFKPVPNPDFIVPITIDGNVHQVYVMKRPGVDEFMQKVCQKYEVVLFTASLSKYANPLLDILDPANTIDYRLFREACVMHCGTYVKDMSLLGRKLRSTIIVDNSPQSYSFHPSNAVPIDSWFDDRSDRQLYDLLPLLSYLADVHDVRDSLDASKPIDWLLHEFKQKQKEEEEYAAQGQHHQANGGHVNGDTRS